MKIQILSSCCVALLALSSSAAAQFVAAPTNTANLPQNLQNATNVNTLIQQQQSQNQGNQGQSAQGMTQPQVAPASSDLNMKWPDQNAMGPVDPSLQMAPGVLAPGAAPGLVNPGQAMVPAVEAKPPLPDTAGLAQSWSNDPVQQLRQSGERLERPLHRGFAHSSSQADQVRLAQWRTHLLNVGVPASKISFEASRLDREAFELWASRFVWWEQATHPNHVDIQQ